MGFSYKDYYESEAVRKAREQLEQNSQYNESDDVIRARDALREHEDNKVEPWTGGTYDQALRDQIDKIANRKEFTYDLNADALYQQYKDQYITGGKYAMMDTMGQAAALTGGYGNSYASAAGNQAYQAYLQKLNDVVPDLYKLALDKYNQEGQDMKNLYSIYANQYDTEYGEYRDRVGDWNAEAARLADQYYNEANMDYSRFADNRDYLSDYYNNERNFDYGQYSDAYQRAFANYQQQIAEQQYWASYNQRQAQYDNAQSAIDYESLKKAANSSGSKLFQASVMTQNEFAKRGMRANGKRYDNYTQYINDVLAEWANNGTTQNGKALTESEIAYLKGLYGLN